MWTLANGGIPMLGLSLVAMVLGFVPVVLMEAHYLGRGTPIGYWLRLAGSFFANLLTTLLGLPIAERVIHWQADATIWLAGSKPDDIGAMWSPWWALVALGLLVPMWAGSAFVESWVLRVLMVREHERAHGLYGAEEHDRLVKQVVSACWLANTKSYTVLAAFWIFVFVVALLLGGGR